MKNNTLYIFCLLIITGLLAFNAHGSEAVIELKNADEPLLIGEQIYYLTDSSDNLSLSDILKLDKLGAFNKYNAEFFTKKVIPGKYWIKFTTTNRFENQLWLSVVSTFAWEIDFYYPDSMGVNYQLIESGTFRKVENEYGENIYWLPLVNSNKPVTYYLSVKSGIAYDIPFYIGTPQALVKQNHINYLFTYIFLGGILLLFLYNLFIYLSIKSSIYLYYLGYLLIMLLGMPFANNFPFIDNINIGSISKEWWHEYFIVWHAFAYLFMGLFCISFLNLKKNSKGAFYILLSELILLVVIFPLINLFGIELNQIVAAYQGFVILFYFSCAASGLLVAFKGVNQAYIYLAGWSFLIVSVFLYFSLLFGLMPYSPFIRNITYIGILMEIWMFSMALGNRLNVLQKENLQLANDYSKELEKQVADRTSELEMVNSELTVSNTVLKVSAKKLQSKTKELKKLNDYKNKMFAIVSHDLKSPLNALQSIIELVDHDLLTKESYIQISDKIKEDVEHAHFTLNNVLSWAVTQLEGTKNNPQKLNLAEVFSNSVNLFNDIANQKNIQILNAVNKEIFIEADLNYVRVIFRNLLSNAIKFTPEGGEVKIDADLSEKFVTVSIADTGIGMGEKEQKMLFNSVDFNSKKGTDGEKGTGIGLTICKEFVNKCNGEIWVKSEVNKGTTFYFTLPVYKNN